MASSCNTSSAYREAASEAVKLIFCQIELASRGAHRCSSWCHVLGGGLDNTLNPRGTELKKMIGLAIDEVWGNYSSILILEWKFQAAQCITQQTQDPRSL